MYAIYLTALVWRKLRRHQCRRTSNFSSAFQSGLFLNLNSKNKPKFRHFDLLTIAFLRNISTLFNDVNLDLHFGQDCLTNLRTMLNHLSWEESVNSIMDWLTSSSQREDCEPKLCEAVIRHDSGIAGQIVAPIRQACFTMSPTTTSTPTTTPFLFHNSVGGRVGVLVGLILL